MDGKTPSGEGGRSEFYHITFFGWVGGIADLEREQYWEKIHLSALRDEIFFKKKPPTTDAQTLHGTAIYAYIDPQNYPN